MCSINKKAHPNKTSKQRQEEVTEYGLKFRNLLRYSTPICPFVNWVIDQGWTEHRRYSYNAVRLLLSISSIALKWSSMQNMPIKAIIGCAYCKMTNFLVLKILSGSINFLPEIDYITKLNSESMNWIFWWLIMLILQCQYLFLF